MNVTKITKGLKPRSKTKPPAEQTWEGEGGQPPQRPEDTKRPISSKSSSSDDETFPGPQITQILRDLLGHMPKPQDSTK